MRMPLRTRQTPAAHLPWLSRADKMQPSPLLLDFFDVLTVVWTTLPAARTSLPRGPSVVANGVIPPAKQRHPGSTEWGHHSGTLSYAATTHHIAHT